MPPSTLGTPPDPTVGPGEAAPLTGSAALMAKMRRSGAVTGERRAQDAGDESVGTKAVKSTHSTNNSRSDDSTNDCTTRFFILHGGEASTQIAGDLADKARARGLRPRVVAMDDFKSCALDDASLGVAVAVFVVETVENAQPAEAAGTCLRFFNRKRKAASATCCAAALWRCWAWGHQPASGPADHHGEGLQPGGADAGLRALFLGAERLVTRGEANDAVGLEKRSSRGPRRSGGGGGGGAKKPRRDVRAFPVRLSDWQRGRHL